MSTCTPMRRTTLRCILKHLQKNKTKFKRKREACYAKSLDAEVKESKKEKIRFAKKKKKKV